MGWKGTSLQVQEMIDDVRKFWTKMSCLENFPKALWGIKIFLNQRKEEYDDSMNLRTDCGYSTSKSPVAPVYTDGQTDGHG